MKLPVTMEAYDVSGTARVLEVRHLEQRVIWKRWPNLGKDLDFLPRLTAQV